MAESDFLQLRTGRRLALLSLACAASSALAIAIGERFFWNRPTLFAYENVMETGVLFMAISAILGMASFIRAGDGGAVRPAMIKWTFSLSMLFVVLLATLVVSVLRMPPFA